MNGVSRCKRINQRIECRRISDLEFILHTSLHLPLQRCRRVRKTICLENRSLTSRVIVAHADIIYVMIDGSGGRSGVSTSIECDAHFLTSIRSQIERLRLSHRRKCFVSRVFPNAYWRPIGAVFSQNGNRKGAAYAISIGRSCSARRGGRNGQIKRQKQIVATFLIHDDLRTDERILLRTGRRRIGS